MSTSASSEFKEVPAKISFAEEETKTLGFWNTIDAFKTSLEKSQGRKPFTFYDGPPFATGLPHYGHLLAGTIKDIVTRYAHQTGHHVERRFGWDCHGLPIEFEIEKDLGIKTKDDVMKFGIANYNAACRSIVMRYSSEWERTVSRMGRWIDFENDYKTMNLSFMESVWWVFRQLFDKGLVYKGFKVMPYSTSCTTPLSNFEAKMNYKDVSDPSVTITFPVVDEPGVSFVAWTTTPWTLPSNLALCVNPTMEYVKLRDIPTGKIYILAESRLEQVYSKKQKDNYQILERFPGATLEGKRYEPLFPYFANNPEYDAFRVVVDTYVTSDSGTGIVHCAPGFGEDDYRVCMQSGVIRRGESLPCPIDANGRFTQEVPDFVGVYVKDADNPILEKIKAAGRLISKAAIVHSYPFCWRSETPLIYKAVPSWFIRVEDLKSKLLENNLKTYWVPDFVQEKRFHNWLQEARDWSVSRNRYWGTPIPIWASADFEEIVCVGSVAELEELTGEKITDLHRESIDHLTIPSRTGKAPLRKVEEVFDCWFESGAMPYAQCHYPFENKEHFERSFPADFIAEGLDQTRGWFYTLLVLGTALFDTAPFKNLIVNGLVLAADGKKMSKRLKNYPDPVEVIDKYGADALRLYLINSPVVRAEPLRFKEDGVRDIIKDVLLPWFNAYRFFIENAAAFQKETGSLFTSTEADATRSTNVFDRWIVSSCQSLIKYVREEMKAYHLYTVVPRLVKFIDELTNWFVRMNRKRLKGAFGVEDWKVALCTLYSVLLKVARTMAPFTPFLTEMMYQNLKQLMPEAEREDSIHYVMVPECDESLLDPTIETAIARLQDVIILGRAVRDKKKVSLKMPVSDITIINKDPSFVRDLTELSAYLREELNTKNVVLTSEESRFITLKAEPDNKILGKRMGSKFPAFSKRIKTIAPELIAQYEATGTIEFEGETLAEGELKITREFIGSEGNLESLSSGNVIVVVNLTPDQQLINEGIAREVINRVQKLRKSAGLKIEDNIDMFVDVPADAAVLLAAIDSQSAYIASNLRGKALVPVAQLAADADVIVREEVEVADIKFFIVLARAA